MKKFLIILFICAFTSSIITSCATTKRDCQGVKHVKQKGGFYM